MYILNLEDNVFKYYNICRAIERGSFADLKIDHIEDLEGGISKIEESIDNGKSYDVIITDMWYPKKTGGGDANSGEELIKIIKEKGWNIPIILCSSVNYCYPGIAGSVHYSENKDWESELVRLIKEI